MSPIALILLSLATSADALVVCLACSLAGRCRVFRNVIAVSMTFAFCAFTMMLLGCKSVNLLAFDRLPDIRFSSIVLILILGLRTLRSGVEVKGSGQDTGVGAFEGMMLVAALASSVDCFVLGAGLQLQGAVSPWLLLSVGGGSGLASLAGLLLGSKVSCFAGGNGECFAGLVLIAFALLGWAGQWSC